MNVSHTHAGDGRLSNEETMALLLAIRGQGIMDQSLLNLFEATPRRIFLNAGQVQAGLDPQSAAPISCGQIQTAPSVIASVVEALKITPNDRVLEIGTGSGYQSSILSRLCKRLYTIDRFKTLIRESEQRFSSLKLTNIITRVSDGGLGWADQGSFDRIVVNAGVSVLPTLLLDQLRPGGILIAPILQGNINADLVIHTKTAHGLEVQALLSTRFLPLIPDVALHL